MDIPKELFQKNQARMKPGTNLKSTKSLRRRFLKAFKSKKYRFATQSKANLRRLKQIESGKLTASNGLVTNG